MKRLAVALMFVTGLVGAEPASSELEAAERLAEALDYTKANVAVERAITRGGLSRVELTRAYRLLAVTSASLGRAREAESSFFKLLELDPEYVVDPNLAPKVTAPFAEARARFRAAERPAMDLAVSSRAARATVSDPAKLVTHIRFHHRYGAGDWTLARAPLTSGVATTELAPAASPELRIAVWAEALDEHENVVFAVGSADRPKTFANTVAPPPRPKETLPASTRSSSSVLASPVFWIVAGAFVVGGATAVYFAVR